MNSIGYILKDGARLLAYVAVARDTNTMSDRARSWIDSQVYGPCYEARHLDPEETMAHDPLLACIGAYATGIVERRGERYHVRNCRSRSCVEGALLEEINDILKTHSGPVGLYDDSPYGSDFLGARMFSYGCPLSAGPNGKPIHIVNMARYVPSSCPSSPVPLHVATELLGMGQLETTPTIAELTRSFHAMSFGPLEDEVFRRLHSTALIHTYLENDGALPFVQVEIDGWNPLH